MSAAAALDADAAPGGEAKQGGKKKKLLLALPVLLAVIGAGLWFSGILPGLLGKSHEGSHDGAHEAKQAEVAPAGPIYVEVPELISNLNSNPRRPSYIKLKPKIEVSRAEDVARVQAAMPRLLDMFQTYLREMRPEELRGSVGIHRLREELIARANIAAAPGRVVDVLFTEMLVQ